MTAPIQPDTVPPPSLATLLRTTVVALLAAGAILIVFVLPAEYGVDPTGIGRRLGLTAIASPPVAPVEPEAPANALLSPTIKGPLGVYPAEFKFDAFEIALGPYEYVEYKYRLEKGATMLYSWSATGAVRHDMHGDRTGDAAGEAAEESFDKEDRRQASGTLAAPFSGIHGWYWENPGGETITIRLTSAGYYSSALEIRSDRTRRTRTLRTIDSLHTGEGK